MLTVLGSADEPSPAGVGAAPQTNSARIAQMLGLSVADAVLLWKDIQAHLQEPLAMSAAVVAIGRLLAHAPPSLVGAREVASFIVAERAAEREAAEKERWQREQAERQAKLRRRRKRSPVAVAAARKAAQTERRLADDFAAKAEDIKVRLAKDYAKRLVAVQDRAKATQQASEILTARKIAAEQNYAALKTEEAQRLHVVEFTTRLRAQGAEKKAEAAEMRAAAAKEALANEIVAAAQTLENVRREAAEQVAAAKRSPSLAKQTPAVARAAKVEKVAPSTPKPAPARKTAIAEVATKTASVVAPSTTSSRLAIPASPIASTAKTRVEMIQSICQERGIEWVVHFTHVDNLQGILTNGLLGRSVLERAVGPSKAHFNDAQRLDGYREAICVSISFPNNLMFYKYSVEDRSAWTVLLLSPSLLWETDCAFCQQNAATINMRNTTLSFRKTPDALRQMFADFGEVRRASLGIPDSFPTDPQAEVLAFDAISPNYIREVHFYKDLASQVWQEANPGGYLSKFQFRGCPTYFGWPTNAFLETSGVPNSFALGYRQPSSVARLSVAEFDILDDPFSDG